MGDPKRETDVLRDALNAFRRVTGLNVEARGAQPWPEDVQFHAPIVHAADATVCIEVPRDAWMNGQQRHAKRFVAEIKMNVTKTTLAMLLNKIHGNLEVVPILITNYVAPQMAAILKENNIQFMDTLGNAYVNDPPLYVFITGLKPVTANLFDPINRAYRPAGLRIIFTLLCNLGMENKPVRQIAENAKVATGAVPRLLRELKEMGFLIDRGKYGRKLINKGKLLEHWVNAYPNQLRPKQVLGRYTTEIKDWWMNTNLEKYQAQWGGEAAAAKLTQYLRPQNFTIYTDNLPNKMLVEARFAKDDNGNIEVLRKFWNFNPDINNAEIVHPILVYADLIRTGDVRNIETARMILEHDIDRFIRED